MDDLNIKQLVLAIRTIAEEKNLPEETVRDVRRILEAEFEEDGSDA